MAFVRRRTEYGGGELPTEISTIPIDTTTKPLAELTKEMKTTTIETAATPFIVTTIVAEDTDVNTRIEGKYKRVLILIPVVTIVVSVAAILLTLICGMYCLQNNKIEMFKRKEWM
ncbi:uncharacterized protein [Apostichopus japonicus]|uniref:uncharacterized protein isoform X1 n=1 Tax=Stichopus japonicus TaxID=307972 RepID=UPI003AB7A976